MAPAPIQSNKSDSVFAAGTTQTCTYTSALTPGSFLVGYFSVGANTTIAVADPTNGSWTLGTPRYWANVGYNQVIGYVQNTASSAVTVTTTYGASASFRTMIICEFSGVATSSPVDIASAGKDNSATTGPVDTAFTTLTAGDLIISGTGADGPPSITAGSGFTLREYNSGSGTALEWQVQTSAGSITPAFVLGSAVQATIISTAFKAAAGGGGGAAVPPSLVMAPRWN
jgi:hypothetical protein